MTTSRTLWKRPMQVLSDSIKDMEIPSESGNHSKSYSVYSKC